MDLATLPAAPPVPPEPQHSAGRWLHPPALMLVAALTLLTIGMVTLFSASAWSRDNPYAYVLRQGVALFVATAAGVAVFLAPYAWVRRGTWLFATLVVAGLVATLVPGVGVLVNGSRRWIDLGPFNLQVSELAKLGLVLVLAHFLAANQARLDHVLRGFLAPLAIIGAVTCLISLQPDFGTAAICGTVGLLLLFLAGAKWRFLFASAALGAAFLSLKIVHNPNRVERFLAFLDVESHKADRTYQLWQGWLGFAAGGMHGVGIGNGRQQLHFLPEAHNDFIFVIVGEEMGLVVTLPVVFLFAAFLVLGFFMLRRAPNLYDYLVVAGCTLIVTLQGLGNLGVVTGLLPTKGLGLPFVSYGGSNLLLMGLVLGLLFNIHRSWDKPPLPPHRRPLEELTS